MLIRTFYWPLYSLVVSLFWMRIVDALGFWRHLLKIIVSGLMIHCNVVRARGESNLVLVHTCMIAIITHYLITNSVCACCYCVPQLVAWVEEEYDVEIALVSKYGSPSFLWWHIIKLIRLFHRLECPHHNDFWPNSSVHVFLPDRGCDWFYSGKADHIIWANAAS